MKYTCNTKCYFKDKIYVEDEGIDIQPEACSDADKAMLSSYFTSDEPEAPVKATRKKRTVKPSADTLLGNEDAKKDLL